MPIQLLAKGELSNTKKLLSEVWKYWNENPDPIPNQLGPQIGPLAYGDDILKAVMLPSMQLIEKVNKLKGSKYYEAAANTVRNFLQKTQLEKDPYWMSGELVPTELLAKMREYNRIYRPKYTGHYEEVKDAIKNGITEDYPMGFWNPKTNYIHLGEGNTRVTAASEMEIPVVPMRVYKSERLGAMPGVQVPNPIKPNQFGYIPSSLKPSELGIDYYDGSNLLELLKKLQNK